MRNLVRVSRWLRELEWLVSLWDWIRSHWKQELFVGGIGIIWQYFTDAFTFTITHWPGLLGGAVTIFGLTMLLVERRELRKAARIENYDMPIKEALRLFWENVNHSFRSSGVSDRYFFDLLHKKMCSGDLPVVGRLGRGGDIQIVSPPQCQRLIPREINVPKNPTALQGVSFVFSPSEIRTPPSKMFWGLRVRSEDLQQIWPETDTDDEQP